MSEKFDNKMLMDPKSWVQYRQFVNSKRPISNPYFNDPEYLKLYSQYITSPKREKKKRSQVLRVEIPMAQASHISMGCCPKETCDIILVQ